MEQAGGVRVHRHEAVEVSGAICEVVLDRSDAIERALRAARPGDLVMILGRGSLSGVLLDRSGLPRPFDDRETARRLLARISPSRRQSSVRLSR